ncbi:hypothetical protein BT93_K2373 [Corymbia citriodora subsp. variegata]|nr:hypothetical protein BT93_K2373 [Corymbia citriodora subsp. variegata]
MSRLQNDPLLQVETTCGTLLCELQIIWDEVGESDVDRDQMLLELEKECLQVYMRKVDQANRYRAQLRQKIADSEAELAAICSAMGERPVHIRQSDQNAGSLKEELKIILPQLEEMGKRKCERRQQFLEVLEQKQNIINELHRSKEHTSSKVVVDESDLSLRKLEELHRQLHALQQEKSNRLKQIQDHMCTLNSLCMVLGLDFKPTVSEVHFSLGNAEGSKDISNSTIEQLASMIQNLREIKLQRMQRLQDLATNLLELWNLMDTPLEEQQMFQNVTCNVAASEPEISEPNALSVASINHVEAEVARLEELKLSKMKELVLKKRSELEEICRKTHLIPEEDSTMKYIVEATESGATDAAFVLEQIEVHIVKVKEEAFSRKELLEKVEKWLAACDEECWLEEYNRDENRYNAGRGAHLILKRAEKARSLVNKLPAMVEALASKTVSWEKERGIEFTYDGDQKKLHGQLIAEQETLYGSKPSPSKVQTLKKAPRISTGGASSKRLSLGGAVLQTPKADPLHSLKATPHSRPIKKGDRVQKNDRFNNQPDVSTGRRGLDAAGPAAYNSFGAATTHQLESPMRRKPFSPIPVLTKAHRTNSLDNANVTPGEMLQKAFPSNSTFSTPLKKTLLTSDDENMTPRTMPIHVPTTPSTVSVPMHTAMTPDLLSLPSGVVTMTVKEIPEEIEYSFEERRAGFVLPKTNIKSISHV